MLTPDYFYGKSDRLVEMYQELEDWILKDIAMRLMKSGEMSGTTDRELWKLQQMGLHNTEIVKRISQLTGKSRDEVRRLLRDSVMTSFSDDMEVLQHIGNFTPPMYNNSAIKVMDAELKKTFGELDNLTQSTMMQTQKDLLNMLNEVDFRVSSGMQSYSSAVCEVLDRYAKGGVVIDYPTGARRTLEAAVRCCIVTSMNQTAAQVTNQYIVESGIEYVLVSAHMGARHDDKHPDGVPSHDHWQGKVYKIQGADNDTPNLLEATGYTITSTGTGKVVNPLGLHGYNCRHSHKPWDKSLRNPYVDENGNPKIDAHESQELYEKQSAQRRMERAIRQTKRQLLAKQEELNGIAETDVRDMLQPEYDRLAYRLRMQNQKYKQFCADNKLQTQSDRVKVTGFKRAQAAKANGRATAYQNMKNQSLNEKSLRTKDGGTHGVNWKVVKSKEYTERFSAISNNPKANELAAQRARNALIHRDGKDTEELYAIGLKSGKDISAIVDQNYSYGVKRTQKLTNDVERAERMGDKVLFIHNHPGGTPPSIADINALLENKDAVGITVGHNGSIYYYTKPKQIIEQRDFRVAAMKCEVYNGIEYREKILEELARQLNFEFRRL